MSVDYHGSTYDAKIGRVYLSRSEEDKVGLKRDDTATYVPITSLIEAVEQMRRPRKGRYIDRYALVRDEDNHRLGSSYFMEECVVKPAGLGYVTLTWPRVRGSISSTVCAKSLLRALRDLQAEAR